VNITNLKEWSRIFGFRQVPVWYQSSQETISEFNTIGKHLKILKFVPNPFPFYDWIMGFYERPSNRKALKGPVIERAKKIIDVGVGTGYLLSQLVKVTSEKQQIIAVDLSQQMLNCLNLPWPDNSFDLYVSSYLFDLLPEPELRKAIIDMERVLRPDGYAILITMTTELDGVNKITKQIYRIMNEIYCIGYHKGRWNAVWKFLFAGYAPHCRPIELGKYLRESPRMIIAYTKISHVSFFPVRIYYLRKGHD
jgi:ubiquinone/menaquinone biosynthesis C-methylase UbiE